MARPPKICGKASSPYSISPPTSLRTPCGRSISSCMIWLSKNEQEELANLEIEFKKYRDIQRIAEHENIAKIREIIERYKADERLFLGGISMIADDMVSFVKND